MTKDFIRRMKEDVKSLEEAYAEQKQRKRLKYQGDFKIPRHRFGGERFFKNIIQNTDIEYSMYDFFNSMDKFGERTNLFRVYATDLLKIIEAVKNKKITDETCIYISLKLYASNFDVLINFLKTLASKIKKAKGYHLENNIEDASGILERFKNYDKK